jgi:cytoskeletal protein CcmA (bactofilin family)
MKTKRISKWIGVPLLLVLLLMLVVPPAWALDTRVDTGVLVISTDADDDVYAFAEDVILNATIHGDFIAAAKTVTIEPGAVIDGDLLAAGGNVVIKGEVKGDVRIAGGVLTLNRTGKIYEDLVAAGFSLEVEAGSTVGLEGSPVGGDITFGGSQALIAGTVYGDLDVGAQGLDLRGIVGGKVKAYVGDQKEDTPFPDFNIPGISSYPHVQGGLTVGSEARILGSLEYHAPQEASIPADVIAQSKITYHKEEYNYRQGEYRAHRLPTFVNWLVWRGRWFATLLIAGLLMAWVVPSLTKKSANKLQAKPLHSLGWGFVSFFALFFALLAVVLGMVLLAVLFGFLTLGGLVAIVILVGILAMFVLIFTFVIAAALISQIIVGYLCGRLILARLKPQWAESRIWPLVLGLAMIVVLTAIPWIGWVFGVLTVLLGLGALWMLGREALQRKPTA